MNIFKVNLEFIDEDKEEVTKLFELKFISQRFVKEASVIFSKIYKIQKLAGFLMSRESIECDIVKQEDKEKAKEQFNNLKDNIKEARKEYESLCTEDLFKDKVDLVMRILEKNGIEDKRFFSFNFWDENVDPQELHAFLESCISRGKKKAFQTVSSL